MHPRKHWPGVYRQMKSTSSFILVQSDRLPSIALFAISFLASNNNNIIKE